METLTSILNGVKNGSIDIDQAEKQILDLLIDPVQNPVQSQQMDDYEFNLHRHWKEDIRIPVNRDSDYEGTIKHFQD
jgi:hypothetical protein